MKYIELIKKFLLQSILSIVWKIWNQSLKYWPWSIRGITSGIHNDRIFIGLKKIAVANTSILQEFQPSLISADMFRPPVNSSALNCIVSFHVDSWRVFRAASRRFMIRRVAYHRASVMLETGRRVRVIKWHTEYEYTAVNHLGGAQ